MTTVTKTPPATTDAAIRFSFIPPFLNDEKNLGICGDYFSHSNLEAALLSSELLAQSVS